MADEADRANDAAQRWLDTAYRLADALDHGELYECSGQVIYGWRVGDSEDPTSDAAELLIMMAKEIDRLSKASGATPHGR